MPPTRGSTSAATSPPSTACRATVWPASSNRGQLRRPGRPGLRLQHQQPVRDLLGRRQHPLPGRRLHAITAPPGAGPPRSTSTDLCAVTDVQPEPERQDVRGRHDSHGPDPRRWQLHHGRTAAPPGATSPPSTRPAERYWRPVYSQLNDVVLDITTGNAGTGERVFIAGGGGYNSRGGMEHRRRQPHLAPAGQRRRPGRAFRQQQRLLRLPRRLHRRQNTTLRLLAADAASGDARPPASSRPQAAASG